MHVVQVLAALSVGGSELVATELTEYLCGYGHRVTVIGRDGPLAQRVIDSGAEYLDWPLGRKRLATLRYIRRLSDWIDNEQPDVIHVHSRLPAWICYLALKRVKGRKRPVFITSMHGQYTVSPYSAVMAKGDRVIAVSNHVRDFTLEQYDFAEPQKIVTIHGGTSRSDFPYAYRPGKDWTAGLHAQFPELKDKRLLLLPGRLSRYKGHATFLELVASLASDYPDVHGVILGQQRAGSRYQAELEGLALKEKVTGRISFVGLRNDIREWMASSQIVFNLCSDPPEAFGRTVPEALRLGVPVLAWDHGGVKEILTEMFPAGAVKPDSFHDLLEKTRGFLDHQPQVPESDAFLLSDSMRATLALYESMIR